MGLVQLLSLIATFLASLVGVYTALWAGTRLLSLLTKERTTTASSEQGQAGDVDESNPDRSIGA